MTEQQHPITPPLELVEQWHDTWIDAKVKHSGLMDFIATRAAQWGADQQLAEDAKWLDQLLGTHGDLSCVEHDTIRRALEALPND